MIIKELRKICAYKYIHFKQLFILVIINTTCITICWTFIFHFASSAAVEFCQQKNLRCKQWNDEIVFFDVAATRQKEIDPLYQSVLRGNENLRVSTAAMFRPPRHLLSPAVLWVIRRRTTGTLKTEPQQEGPLVTRRGSKTWRYTSTPPDYSNRSLQKLQSIIYWEVICMRCCSEPQQANKYISIKVRFLTGTQPFKTKNEIWRSVKNPLYAGSLLIWWKHLVDPTMMVDLGVLAGWQRWEAASGFELWFPSDWKAHFYISLKILF